MPSRPGLVVSHFYCYLFWWYEIKYIETKLSALKSFLLVRLVSEFVWIAFYESDIMACLESGGTKTKRRFKGILNKFTSWQLKEEGNRFFLRDNIIILCLARLLTWEHTFSRCNRYIFCIKTSNMAKSCKMYNKCI